MLSQIQAVKYIRPSVNDMDQSELDFLHQQTVAAGTNIVIEKRNEVINYLEDSIVNKNPSDFLKETSNEIIPTDTILLTQNDNIPNGYTEVNYQDKLLFGEVQGERVKALSSDLVVDAFRLQAGDFQVQKEVLSFNISNTMNSIKNIIIKNKAYIIGGNDTLTTVTNKVRYCGITDDGELDNNWIDSFDLPVAMSNYQTFISENYLYIIGGYTTTTVNTIYYAEINEDGTLSQWFKDTNLPTVLRNASTLVIGNKFYMFGGVTTTTAATVYIADITNEGKLKNFRTTTSLPGVKSYTNAFYTGQYIYIIGGNNDSIYTNSIYKASLNQDGTLSNWVIDTNVVPTTIGTSTCFNTETEYYLFGGVIDTTPNYTNKIFKAIKNGDGTLSTFTEIGTLPSYFGFCLLFITKNYLYLLGNRDDVKVNNYIIRAPLNGGKNDYSLDIIDKSKTTDPFSMTLYDNNRPWRNQFNIERGPIVGGDGYLGNIAYGNPLNATQYDGTIAITKNRIFYIAGAVGGSASSSIKTAPIDVDGNIGTWTTNATAAPMASYRLDSFMVGNKLYIYGGYTGNNKVYYTTINEDGTLGTWVVGANLPANKISSQSIVIKNNVYIMGGGTSYTDASAIDTVYKASINEDGSLGTWELSNPLMEKMVSFKLVSTKDRLYILGGHNGTAKSNKIYTCSVNSNGGLGAWELSSTVMPFTNYNFAAVSLNDYIYVFGGEASNVVYRCPVDSNGIIGSTWEQMANLPITGSRIDAAITSSALYLMGNLNASSILKYPLSGGKNNYIADMFIDSDTIYNEYTLTASNGNQSNSQAEFERSYGDIITTPCQLLINGNGVVDGATNTIVGKNNIGDITITKSGNPFAGSISPFEDSGYSCYFDGSSYLKTPNSNNYSLGDVYTIEFWVKILDNNINVCGQFISQCNNSQNTALYLYNAQSGQPTDRLYMGTAGVNEIQGPLFTRDVWHHIAIVGYVGGSKLYVDGILGLTSAHKFNNDFISVGGGLYNNVMYGITGYISNFRVIKGTALYTSDFTIPSGPLSLLPNTSILLDFDTPIMDSTKGHNIKVNGNVQISTSEKKYGTGSIKFDGSSYLSIPLNNDFNFGTGDFTIECWIKRNGINTNKFYIFNIGGVSTGSYGLYIQDGYIENAIYGMTGTIRSSNIDIPANTWCHLASVRNNGILKTFVNGIEIMSRPAPENIINDSIKIGGMLWNQYMDYIGGYIDDFRITKGKALYTSNFTIPTELLPAHVTEETFIPTFTERNTLAASTCYACSFTHKNRAYLLGGAVGTATINKIQYAPINTDGTLGTWVLDSNVLPVNLQVFSYHIIKNNIYLIGGYKAASSYSNIVYKATLNEDGSLGVFTSYNILPITILGHASIIINDYIYIINGYNGSSNVNTIYRAKIYEDGSISTFTLYNNTTLLATRYQTIIKQKNKLYLIGGIASSATSTIYSCYISNDGELSTWKLENFVLPSGRQSDKDFIQLENELLLLPNYNTNTCIKIKFFNNGDIESISNSTIFSINLSATNIITTKNYMYVLGGMIGTTYGTTKTFSTPLSPILNSPVVSESNGYYNYDYSITKTVKAIYPKDTKFFDPFTDQSRINPGTVRTLGQPLYKYGLPIHVLLFDTQIIGNKLYIIGGEIQKISQENSNKVWVCDLVDGVLQYNWTIAGTLPTGLSSVRSFTIRIGDRLYIIGGKGNGVASSSNISNKIFYYKIIKDINDINGVESIDFSQINYLNDLPTGLYNPHIIVIKDKVILYDGLTPSSPTTYTNNYFEAIINDDNSIGIFSSVNTTGFTFGSTVIPNSSIIKIGNYFMKIGATAANTTAIINVLKLNNNGTFTTVNNFNTIPFNNISNGTFRYLQMFVLGNVLYSLGGSPYSTYTASAKITGHYLSEINNNLTISENKVVDINLPQVYGMGKIVITESKLYIMGGVINSTMTGVNQSHDIIEYNLPDIFSFTSNPQYTENIYENKFNSELQFEMNNLSEFDKTINDKLKFIEVI